MKGHSEDTSDERLYVRASAGDAMAFELLYERYWTKLVWFATGFTGSSEKAQDVVQDIFMKLIHKSHLFDAKKKLAPWLFTLTANQCRNLHRDESNRRRILQELEGEGTYESVLNRHDSVLLESKLRQAVAGLSAKEQEIYVLRFVNEMTLQEIAEELSMPLGTVKSTIFYMLKKIAEQLKDYADARR